MTASKREASFSDWLDEYMKLGQSDQPGRIVAVIATCDRLRDNPSLRQEEHLTDSNMQLLEHDHHVARALTRLGVNSPVKAGGRRSSYVAAWIGPLFNWVRSQGFANMDASEKEEFLSKIETIAASRLQIINEGKPLIVRYNQGTSVAIIIDILDQAQKKKRAKDVAEYLVGAKLQIRFGENAAKPKNVNTPNRNSVADFHIGNAAIEVTVSPPDPRHLTQIDEILKNTKLDIWLLVRNKDREKWQNAVDATVSKQLRGRVAVHDIETFVGQNISEIGKFAPATAKTFSELLRVYNDRWLPQAGASGLRIVSVAQEHDV